MGVSNHDFLNSDFDGDGVPNWKDCYPFNPKRHALSGTERVRRWRRKAMQELRDERGGACEDCGSTSELHFHHTGYTPLAFVKSRGMTNRIYDVRKNPDSYKLLCKDCHYKQHGYSPKSRRAAPWLDEEEDDEE